MVVGIDLQSILVDLKSLVLLAEILQSCSFSLVTFRELRSETETLLGGLKGLLKLASVNKGTRLVAKENMILGIKLNGLRVKANGLLKVTFFEGLISLYFKFFCCCHY